MAEDKTLLLDEADEGVPAQQKHKLDMRREAARHLGAQHVQGGIVTLMIVCIIVVSCFECPVEERRDKSMHKFPIINFTMV